MSMVLAGSFKNRLAVLLLPLVLGACASGGTHSTPSTDWRPGKQLHVMAERADRVRLEGAGEVAISSTYIAASGRKCRKLATMDGRALPLRSCESEKGDWYTTRSISVSDPFATAIQSAQSEPLVEASNAVAESVSMKLKTGESLWLFASRVTGNATNWKRIAAFNNIENANSVWANQSLEVESSLLLEGL